MAKRKAPLLAKDATAQIKALLATPRDRWDSSHWKRRDDLAQRAPADVPAKLLGKLLATCDVHELADLPAHFDDAILASLEARDDEPDAAFVLAALRTGRGDHHERLRGLCRWPSSLQWAARADKRGLAKLVLKRPDIVEGARAAVALVDPDDYVTCVYLPVLVVEGSRDSLDLIVPYLERTVKTADSELDWFRKEVVPLFADTPAAKDVVALLAGTAAERTKVSPARTFAKQLGMDPAPDVLQATLSFRDRAGKTLYQVRIDSTLASWLQGRSQWFTLWSTLTPARLVEELPRDRATYVLRVGKGVNRAKLDAWAKSLMAR